MAFYAIIMGSFNSRETDTVFLSISKNLFCIALPIEVSFGFSITFNIIQARNIHTILPFIFILPFHFLAAGGIGGGYDKLLAFGG